MAENRESFVIPIEIDRVTRKTIDFHFQGIDKCLRGILCRDGQLMITAYQGDELWDILTDFDLVEQVGADRRYFCALCDPSTRNSYSLRRDLWLEHSFIPLREWGKEVLTRYRNIEFHQTPDGGGTWVAFSESLRKSATGTESLRRSVRLATGL